MKPTSNKESEIKVNIVETIVSISDFLDKKYLIYFCLNIFKHLSLLQSKESAKIIVDKL